MRPARLIATLILISLVARPAVAFSQEPVPPAAPDPWTAVKSLPMGSNLDVRLRDSKRVKGSLITATDAELRLSLSNSITTIERDSIRKVYQIVKREEGGKAEIIGTLAGGATGVALVAGESDGEASASALVLIGLLFAALGYSVGRAFSTKQKKLLIYETKI